MKNLKYLLLIVIFATFASCGSQMKGSASDRTGTNGNTNGTGKIAKDL